MIHRWSELASPELRDRIHDRSIAVLVLGAIEQHGPHLPVATDLIIGEGLCEAMSSKLAEDLSVFVLPSLALGASQEHGEFCGTLSLPPDLAARVIEAVGASLASSGIRRLVLLNAHGGNHAVIDSAALTLRREHGLLVVKANYMKLSPPDGLLAVDELREGLHGGQAETAMMLHLAPEQVRQDRFEHFRMRDGLRGDDGLFGPAGRAAWAWMAEDLNPKGVVGRAQLATAEDGRRLIDHYAVQLADVVERTALLSWPVAD
jgi:creatinine amidohydrolase